VPDRAELAVQVADEIMERLGSSVIPSCFPAEVGDWIRNAHKHGACLYRHIIPMGGPTALFADYRVNPDGTLNLEFQDTNGRSFWRGTFRPVEAS
jgi:hypothetical protein